MAAFLLHFDRITITEGNLGEQEEQRDRTYQLYQCRSYDDANHMGSLLELSMDDHEFIESELIE